MKKPKIKVEVDFHGWADVTKFKPTICDLVKVKNTEGQEQLGWWNGSFWDWGKKHITGEVTHWKKLPRGYEFL